MDMRPGLGGVASQQTAGQCCDTAGPPCAPRAILSIATTRPTGTRNILECLIVAASTSALATA
eukprot:CAMPEP_0174362386 /NCGR_PEP_ID=MMETSP0811_2-20130205/64121_1 /TAXON_ID=73025 ORGANISM="Eutreptiella gymnastica-like, Strain CCMP1594" /NCGR_SAMPLE_ID=MMETSP0811_2 /ASSEMBLY_ACC=CAM_ASM_000667 /LENGTH=62 /DNA_ID=CAMNT_0015500015 /DNA_START=178 /DNA_END=362 /DNA_ORIENTATION=+